MLVDGVRLLATRLWESISQVYITLCSVVTE
jgi:hypothetical protein